MWERMDEILSSGGALVLEQSLRIGKINWKLKGSFLLDTFYLLCTGEEMMLWTQRVWRSLG